MLAALSNASGAVIERFAYDAHGQAKALASNFVSRPSSNYDWEFRYTGRRQDLETGLMYFRARYYSTELGRFISRDPLGFADGMSLYRGYFVPRMVDPFGQEVLPVDSRCWSRCSEIHAQGTVPEVVRCYKKCKDNREIIVGESCNDILNPVAICRYSDAFNSALALYKKKCKRSVVVECGMRPGSKGSGSYTPSAHTINLKKLEGGFTSCITLAHELLHAADECDVNRPKDPLEECRYSLCKEARANVYFNCCYEGKNPGGDNKCFQKCVNWKKRVYTFYASPQCNNTTRAQRESFWDACEPKPLTMTAVCGKPIPPMKF